MTKGRYIFDKREIAKNVALKLVKKVKQYEMTLILSC